MQLKGYEVWVSSEGKRLPEYCIQPEGVDGKTIACFIPSECGKNFTIQWRDRVNNTHLRFVTKIDGSEAGGNRCLPGGSGSRWGVRTSTTSRQPFKFAKLQTTDQDDLFVSAARAELGEIEVAVSRIRAEYRSIPHTGAKFRPVGPVNERCKKAGVHCVALGDEVRARTHCIQTTSTPLNPREGDMARFIFRYRPLALLQAQGIVQPSGPGVKVEEVPVAGPSRQRQPASRSESHFTARRHGDVEDSDVEERKPRVKLEDVKPKREAVKSDVEDEGLGSESEVEEDLEDLQSQMEELQRRIARAAKRKRRSADVKEEEDVKPAMKRLKRDPEEPPRRKVIKREVVDLTLSDSD